MTCPLRCPLNWQICENCLCCDDLPADGPYPDMFKPSERMFADDESWVLKAGTFGL